MTDSFIFIIAALAICSAASAASYDTSAKREPKGTRLQVHIVPHTHDDAGWLKTVDQYYWGLRNDIQPAGVQYTLDTAVQSLIANPDRRFTYAEVVFFSRWWHQQDADTQATVKDLVKEKRLNFVNGGYVGHDEAAAHYVGMIDQTTRGHQFLKEVFNITPRVGWQIDPFGHSSIQAGLLGPSLGFDAVFFGRADYQDMEKRANAQELEHLWRGTGAAGSTDRSADSSNTLFTGNFASGNYGPPPGFWWEWSSSGDAIIADDPALREYNVPERVETFVQRCFELANVTHGRDIMLTMGSDFHYANAHVWYKNLDKLMHYVNLDGRINVFYSSPEDYVFAKYSYNDTWPVKYDDFFPYADIPHGYWTGYFTSRPASKGYIRQATAYLQAARQLEAYVGRNFGGKDGGPSTSALEDAISIAQHHDSITGTARQHVANDYHSRIHEGMEEAQKVVIKALKHLLQGGGREATTQAAPLRKLQFDSASEGVLHQQSVSEYSNLHLEACPLLNVSACAPTVTLSSQGQGIFAVIYNPLAWSRKSPVRIPISTLSTCSWKVFGPQGQIVPSQIVPVDSSTTSLQTLLAQINATDPSASADAELVFTAELPPLGYSSFMIQKGVEVSAASETEPRSCFSVKNLSPLSSPSSFSAKSQIRKSQRSEINRHRHRHHHHHCHGHNCSDDPLSITNGLITVHFDSSTGIMSSISVENGGPAIDVSATMHWYNASDGQESDQDKGQASSAYIFRPNGEYPLHSSCRDCNGVETHPKKLSLISFFSFGRWLQRMLHFGRHKRCCCHHHKVAEVQVVEGDEVSEVRQIFDDWAVLITRLHKGQKYVEIEWTVGPIPIDDNYGKEIIIRYSSNIDSNDEFYTDANGRAMMRRRLNKRPTWDLNVTEDIAGNYYPVTAAAYIEDESAQLAVLIDRSQGAASLRQGELEFMVHRRALVDDRRGVVEPLNETMCGCINCDCPGLVVRGRHWLVVAAPDAAAQERRHYQQVLNDPPVHVFGPIPASPGLFEEPITNSEATHSTGGGGSLTLRRTFSLSNDRILHTSAHLLTLMQNTPHSILVRLAHLFDDSEGTSTGGLAVTEDLGALLEQFHCSGKPQEVTLSGNQLKSEAEKRRLKFKAGESMTLQDWEGDNKNKALANVASAAVDSGTFKSSENVAGEWLVHLEPMEVRTYEVVC